MLIIDTSHCDPSTCNHNGECIELRNTFQCQCKDGYKGPTCSITVNRCKKESCLNGGTCVVTSNKAFTCYCKPGYTGSRCEQGEFFCCLNCSWAQRREWRRVKQEVISALHRVCLTVCLTPPMCLCLFNSSKYDVSLSYYNVVYWYFFRYRQLRK